MYSSIKMRKHRQLLNHRTSLNFKFAKVRLSRLFEHKYADSVSFGRPKNTQNVCMVSKGQNPAAQQKFYDDTNEPE